MSNLSFREGIGHLIIIMAFAAMVLYGLVTAYGVIKRITDWEEESEESTDNENI